MSVVKNSATDCATIKHTTSANIKDVIPLLITFDFIMLGAHWAGTFRLVSEPDPLHGEEEGSVHVPTFKLSSRNVLCVVINNQLRYHAYDHS